MGGGLFKRCSWTVSFLSYCGEGALGRPFISSIHTHTPGVPSGSSTPSGSHPKAPPGLAQVPVSEHMCRSHQPLKDEDSWSTGPCHESRA